MHHVAAVASLPSTTSTFTSTTTSQPGRPPSDEPGRRVRLLTWGQGQKGQLGNEGLKDRMVPQPVPTIEGKKVLQVSVVLISSTMLPILLQHLALLLCHLLTSLTPQTT